jgi:RNA polymerase sigma-70 factor (ECF subfamily)
MGSQYSDEELVELASQGKGDAFDTLVDRYKDRVFNLLVRMSGSEEDAEDLAQDAFFRCWRALGSFRKGSRFYTWLYRIALNTGFTQRRDKARLQKHESGSLDAGVSGNDNGDPHGTVGSLVADRRAADPGANLEQQHLQKRVQEGLGRIDEDYRRILILRDIEGLDYDAIAETIEISRAAVKSRLHRARKEMARILKDLKP